MLALLSSPVLAQTDAGVDPCDPSCDAALLSFCDGEEPSTLDCAALGGRCGELSPAWGADCLLPEGAACEPGYAFGESRCDRAASLYCLDGSCQVASGPEAPAPLTPTPGTSDGSSGASAAADPFGCESCGTASAFGLLCFGGALRRLRRLVARAR